MSFGGAAGKKYLAKDRAMKNSLSLGKRKQKGWRQKVWLKKIRHNYFIAKPFERKRTASQKIFRELGMQAEN